MVTLTKTLILKLTVSDTDEHETSMYHLERTVQLFAKGMNHVSEVVYGLGKPRGAMAVQKLVYKDLRQTVGLKSQMSCNAVRQAVGAYSSLWKQVKSGQSQWQHINFRPSALTVSYRRDFTINETELSITTINGRKKYLFVMYPHAKKYFDGTWTFGASKVIKHRDGDYYFHLSCEKEIDEKPLEESKTFMGVDVGQNYLAVASTTDQNCAFFCGGIAKDIRNTYFNMRKRLQLKGTRSSKRVLKNISGREKRLMNAINHKVSKDIISFAVKNHVDVIGLEDLTGIRTHAKRRKKDRYTHHSWAFYQIQDLISYKAMEHGIRVEYIDPRYTSQTCPRCNHISRNNRNKKTFHCECCGFDLHSDLIGARNIESRARASRYTCEVQGRESTAHTEPVI